MNAPIFVALIWLVLIVVLFFRLRRRRTHIGSGAAGAVYDMLSDEKRKAIEIVVEERAAARDPEDRDGNLPDLETPRRQTGNQ
jgi:hypothetical protein